ncbi:hypothetical protein VCHENC02_3869A, partial [Vibrio harveyi]
MLTHGFY